MDIRFLFEPELRLERRIILTILPLAPLSMSHSLPGSYYHSQDKPTKFMLCGLLENLLGWHFPDNIRSDIRQCIKDKTKQEPAESPSGYKPLLFEQFDFAGPDVLPSMMRYNDYCSFAAKRNDGGHIGGLRHFDSEIQMRYKWSELTDTKFREPIFKENSAHFPRFYMSPQRREYIAVKTGTYIFCLKLAPALAQVVAQHAPEKQTAYLGHSEGWVDVLIEFID